MLFQRDHITHLSRRLAEDHQVYLGTSSWRYPGWCGLLYDEDRYLWGTHFSKKRFSEHCLEEYASVFPTVCVDATYYALPKVAFIEGIASQVPEDFLFSFKVPDDITIKTFPDTEAFGDRAGKANDLFLSAGLLNMGFLRRLEPIKDRVGALIFEFSHFQHSDFEHGRDFVDALDHFFSEAPKGWRYAVEIRNHNWLHPAYFQMLERHGVAHVYNQWTRMPSVIDQIGLHPLEANPFVIARYLLTPGRSFQWARDQFEPFHQLRELDPVARESMVRIIRHAIHGAESKPSFLYVGNELEGNALHTFADVLETVALG
ncbi:MAG: DUF72 domain-containing protein [Verrucomicrobiae bacterium]|nr:DUF72 domain-containing protein [Verrucomicrobiae bacterium]